MSERSEITQLPTDEQLRIALQFCLDIASEELPYAQVGQGAEVALRHIVRKCTEALRPPDPIGDALRKLPVIGTLYIDDPHDPRNKELKL